MAVIESSEAILPYLNPDYWNGHSIGYGENLGRPPRLQVFGQAVKQSKQSLQERLALMEKAVPLETCGDGQTFDAEGYELGTIVIFRDERLSGDPDRLTIDVGSLKGQPLPARPFDVSPSFGRTSTSETIRDANLYYFTAARWGIIGVNRARKKVLHSVSTGLVDKLGADRVLIALPSLKTEENPIKIGETKHYAGPYGESLNRVNILDVLAYGRAEKKRSIANLAARLAFGGNT